MNDDKTLIDIRSEISYRQGHIPNARNIPANYLLLNYKKYLKKEKIYYIYCQNGLTSKRVVQKLNSLGYNTRNYEGGYNQYLSNK